MILPKGHLSYSAMTLWRKNQDAYRRLYYLGEKPPTSEEMRKGSHVSYLLEKHPDDPSIAFIPRYDTPEKRVEVMITRVPALGFIDSYDSYTGRFREYKTGHLSKTGKAPWDDVKVRKHEQLPFYAMLLKYKYGVTGPQTCHLDWIETRYTAGQIDGGLSSNPVLELTGNIQTFERTIEPWEIERMVDMFVSTAEDIERDYTRFIRSL